MRVRVRVCVGWGGQFPTFCPPSTTPTASQTLEDAKLRPQERPRARGRLTPPPASSLPIPVLDHEQHPEAGRRQGRRSCLREPGLEGVGAGPARGGRPRASNRSALPRVGSRASQVRAGWRSRVWGRALLLSSLLAPGETFVSAPPRAAVRRPSTTAQSSAALTLAWGPSEFVRRRLPPSGVQLRPPCPLVTLSPWDSLPGPVPDKRAVPRGLVWAVGRPRGQHPA